jgi:phospholipid/cholesterol/gamma-HCH transport system ATP-binding protein
MSKDSRFILEVRDLYFYRGKRPIFNGINVSIPRGKVTAIMGPSGTGKTTFIQLLSRQLTPSAGDVLIDGTSIVHANRKALYAQRRKMGMLFQQGALFTDLNVFENVAFSLREHTTLDESMIRDLVLMKLEAVGLRGAAYFDVSELSGGMARRVALARAIMMDPQLMFYDEPFTGQDPISKGVLLKLIRELNDALGMTSIVVSHDVTETLSIADFGIVLSQGGVLGSGTPEELYTSDNPALKQFLGGLPDGEVPFHFPAAPFSQELGL